MSARLLRDDRGASLVEYALALALFLLLFFAALDFGRLLYNWNMTEKAMHIAARMAAVRPPVCAGVPATNVRGSATASNRFGTTCGTGTGVCAGDSGGVILTATCAGDTASATATEIWTRIQGVMPPGATRANLQFTYAFDPKMNFLGGPYVPVVTVELQNLNFSFVSPLMGLATAASGVNQGANWSTIPFPSMSVSLPGEDLALGEAG